MDSIDSISLEDFYRAQINEARAGDRDSAIALLTEVSRFDSKPSADLSPTVVAYIAECLREWLKTDCNPLEAVRIFHVGRPAIRPESPVIRQKHIRALRAYYLMRGRRKGRAAAVRISASSACISESQMEKLLERKHGGLSLEQAAALWRIKNLSVRERCLQPARKQYQRSR